jgi:hypothetical protein
VGLSEVEDENEIEVEGENEIEVEGEIENEDERGGAARIEIEDGYPVEIVARIGASGAGRQSQSVASICCLNLLPQSVASISTPTWDKRSQRVVNPGRNGQKSRFVRCSCWLG